MKLLLSLCSIIAINSFTLNPHSTSKSPHAKSIHNPLSLPTAEAAPSSSRSFTLLLHSTSSPTSNPVPTINELKTEIQNEISSTKRGLSTTPTQKQEIDILLQKLEKSCPLPEPARSPLMGGKWIVDYTTSPPPSNGKLGPFVGFARQIIDLDKGTYVNYLSVPGDVEKEWLSARLEATFSEWDGIFLKDDRVEEDDDENYDDEEANLLSSGDDDKMEENKEQSPSSQKNIISTLQELFMSKAMKGESSDSPKEDYGADSWKVNFESLTVKAFGIPLITKKFENTSRIWKMSYLDEETRIVRAGRTGKDADNMVFYMTREQ